MPGTISDFPNFNPEDDVERLSKAVKGLLTDDEEIIAVLSKRSNKQRQTLKETYKTLKKRDLEKDLRSACGGMFCKVVIAMMQTPGELDAYNLKKALKVINVREDILLELFMTRTRAQQQEFGKAYQKMYNLNLRNEAETILHGTFGELLVSLLKYTPEEETSTMKTMTIDDETVDVADGETIVPQEVVELNMSEEDTEVDMVKAASDAKILYMAGAAQWMMDESRFSEMMKNENVEHIKVVFDEYEKLCNTRRGSCLETDITGALANSSSKDDMLSIVHIVRKMSLYFAQRLHKSMKGLGTDDRGLMRLLISRSEIDLADIKEEFQNCYNASLESFVKVSIPKVYILVHVFFL
jgi:hypothetical protein